MRDGIQVSIGNDPDIFAYLRKTGTEAIIVMLNMSAKEKTFAFQPGDIGITGSGRLTSLYTSTPAAESLAPSKIVLPPFAALVAKMQ